MDGSLLLLRHQKGTGNCSSTFSIKWQETMQHNNLGYATGQAPEGDSLAAKGIHRQARGLHYAGAGAPTALPAAHVQVPPELS